MLKFTIATKDTDVGKATLDRIVQRFIDAMNEEKLSCKLIRGPFHSAMERDVCMGLELEAHDSVVAFGP